MGDRKKSWREIDQGRTSGGSGGGRRDPDAFHRERIAKTAAYSKYKSNLDKLFKEGGGGALPEHLQAKLGPVSEEAQAKSKLHTQLKNKPNEKSLKTFLKAGLALPDDARLLMSLLDIQDEELLRPVLQKLLEIVEDGKKPSRMLLIQRLEAVKNFAQEDETLELAQMIRAELG